MKDKRTNIYADNIQSFIHMISNLKEREDKVAGVVTMDIWAISSCNLCLDHFHSMVECCCACPALWLSGSDNTHFMGNNSGCMVTWCSKFQCSVSNKTQQQAKGYFSKGEQFIQRRTGLCSKILRVCTVIHLQRLAKGSRQHPYLTLTL